MISFICLHVPGLDIATARDDAFHRERQMKRWRRAWKLALIEGANPGWKDLTDEMP